MNKPPRFRPVLRNSFAERQSSVVTTTVDEADEASFVLFYRFVKENQQLVGRAVSPILADFAGR
jgi:acyl-CoA thioesterase FadM